MKTGPRIVTLNVTERCEGRCRFCNCWLSRVKDPALEELLKVVDELARLGVKAVRLSGGEPLLRTDLGRMISRIEKTGMFSMICTSANAPSDNIEKVLAAGPDIISVSLDSLDPEIFRFLRGYDLSPVLDKLKWLKKRQENGFEIVISTVLTRKNIEGIDRLLTYTGKHDFILNITPYQPVNENKELEFQESDYDFLRNALDRIKEAAVSGLRIINGDSFLDGIIDFYVRQSGLQGHTCRTGEDSIIRTAQGEWKLCHSLPPVGGGSLKSIWNSVEAKNMRRRMAALDCPLCWLSCHADERRNIPYHYGKRGIRKIL